MTLPPKWRPRSQQPDKAAEIDKGTTVPFFLSGVRPEPDASGCEDLRGPLNYVNFWSH